MNFIRHYSVEIVGALCLLAVAYILYAGHEANHTKFAKACDEAGGKSVWDGRQFQCLKNKEQ